MFGLNLSSVNVVEDEVKLLRGLKGVMKADEEGMLQALQENVSLSHDVLLLEDTQDISEPNIKTFALVLCSCPTSLS